MCNQLQESIKWIKGAKLHVEWVCSRPGTECVQIGVKAYGPMGYVGGGWRMVHAHATALAPPAGMHMLQPGHLWDLGWWAAAGRWRMVLV